MYKFNKKEHFHSFDNKALFGTSTVVGVISKPLTWWSAGLAVGKFGWLDPKKNSPLEVKNALERGFNAVKGMDLPEYEKLLAEAYKAHSVKLKETASTGTDLHAELERFVNDSMNGLKGEYPEQIKPFIEWCSQNVSKFIWSEKHCYSSDPNIWSGGITDAGAVLINGDLILFDFKSSKDAYMSQFIQGGGYVLQIEENGLFYENGNMFLSPKEIKGVAIVPFGAEVIEPKINYDVESLKAGYKAAVCLYKLTNS